MNTAFKLMLLSFLMFAQSAIAVSDLVKGEGCHSRGSIPGPWGDDRPNCGSIAGCAPEVQNGNLTAADRILQELAKNELKGADKFAKIVTQVSALESNKRLAAYLKLAGIESDADIAQFVGSRDRAISSNHIMTLSKTTDITSEQAELVLHKISAALLGEIK